MSSSYLFYLSTILTVTGLVWISEKFPNKQNQPNRLFWYSAASILIFVMGLRTLDVGVDDYNYLLGYEQLKSMTLKEYYSIRITEPGFYLLSLAVFKIFDNFTMLIFITSLITIIFFFKAIEIEFKNISLAWVVFIFSTTQYFYFFGIIRLGLAASIIAFGYRYIIRGETKKFIIIILIATCFHYSALYAVLFLLIYKYTQENLKISKIVFYVPLAFLCVQYLVYPFISIDRYENYKNVSGFFSFDFLNSIPFLIIFLYKIGEIKKNKSYQFYFALFILKILTEMFSPLIGIQRMIWYLNLSMCFLLAYTIKKSDNYLEKYIITIFTIFYCFYYSYYAYFGSSFRSDYMLPYKNIFFELLN